MSWTDLSVKLMQNVIGRLDLMSRYSFRCTSRLNRFVVDDTDLDIPVAKVSVHPDKYVVKIYTGIEKFLKLEISKSKDNKSIVTRSENGWKPEELKVKTSPFSPADFTAFILTNFLAHQSIVINIFDWEFCGVREPRKKEDHLANKRIEVMRDVLIASLDQLEETFQIEKLMSDAETPAKFDLRFHDFCDLNIFEKTIKCMRQGTLVTMDDTVLMAVDKTSENTNDGNGTIVASSFFTRNLPDAFKIQMIYLKTSVGVGTLRFAHVDEFSLGVWTSISSPIMRIAGNMVKTQVDKKSKCTLLYGKSDCGIWITSVPQQDLFERGGVKQVLAELLAENPCGLGWLCKKCADPFEHWYCATMKMGTIPDPIDQISPTRMSEEQLRNVLRMTENADELVAETMDFMMANSEDFSEKDLKKMKEAVGTTGIKDKRKAVLGRSKASEVLKVTELDESKDPKGPKLQGHKKDPLASEGPTQAEDVKDPIGTEDLNGSEGLKDLKDQEDLELTQDQKTILDSEVPQDAEDPMASGDGPEDGKVQEYPKDQQLPEDHMASGDQLDLNDQQLPAEDQKDPVTPEVPSHADDSVAPEDPKDPESSEGPVVPVGPEDGKHLKDQTAPTLPEGKKDPMTPEKVPTDVEGPMAPEDSNAPKSPECPVDPEDRETSEDTKDSTDQQLLEDQKDPMAPEVPTMAVDPVTPEDLEDRQLPEDPVAPEAPSVVEDPVAPEDSNEVSVNVRTPMRSDPAQSEVPEVAEERKDLKTPEGSVDEDEPLTGAKDHQTLEVAKVLEGSMDPLVGDSEALNRLDSIIQLLLRDNKKSENSTPPTNAFFGGANPATIFVSFLLIALAFNCLLIPPMVVYYSLFF